MSAARTPSRPAPTSSIKAHAPRGPAGAEDPAGARCSTRSPTTLNYADLDALYAAIGENHVSAKSVAERVRKRTSRTSTRRARSSCPSRCASPAGAGAGGKRPRRRARRGPRRRHGAAVAVLHAGARRRDHGLRHPGPRRVGAPQPTAPTRVSLADGPGRPADRRRVGQRAAPASFVASIEVKALDRSRLLRDVTPALADHHVNIISLQHRSPAPTASRRCASTSSSATRRTSTR